jgi:hypothetical protein
MIDVLGSTRKSPKMLGNEKLRKKKISRKGKY